MFREMSVLRAVILYVITVPVAILMGYFMATPGSSEGNAMLMVTMALLLFPLIMTHHYPFMIFALNAAIVLPVRGSPSLGLALAGVSFGIAIFQRAVRHRAKFLSEPSITWPILYIGLVVYVVAQLNGGIGGKSIGSGEVWGAKRYIGVLGAMLTYFAIISQKIPLERVKLYLSLFVLAGLTNVLSTLIFIAGPAFFFLYNFVEIGGTYNQAATEMTINRLAGVGAAGLALFLYLLLRYGISGMLNLSRPWRIVFLIASLVLTAFGGYRSFLLLEILLIGIQFVFEGLLRTKWIFILPAVGLLSFLGLAVGAKSLPLSLQRTMSFMPIELDPIVVYDAQASTDWRVDMWKVLIPEIPKYLWLGKGYTFSGTDYTLTQKATERGFYEGYESTLISGYYHNGILTVLIAFGLPGLFGFLWLVVASLRILWRNYKNSRPELKLVNTFLISLYVARFISYIAIYGHFDLDLVVFTSIVGLSIAINKEPKAEAKPAAVPADGVPDAFRPKRIAMG